MPLFLWKKSYEIRVAEIDRQHRRMVELINKLSEAMMKRQGYQVVQQVIEELLDYIQYHFTTEETSMQERNYPDFEIHCQQHLEFTARVLEFKERYVRDQSLNPSELLEFLCAWLKNHIIASDKQFGQYLRRVEMGLP